MSTPADLPADLSGDLSTDWPGVRPAKVLVTGSAGMLGTAWLQLLEAQGMAHEGHDRDTLDLLDTSAIASALDRVRPTHVINCAAWTDVDGAETQEDAATILNGRVVADLAGACAKRGITLAHYSTDYVFSGSATEPYPVDAPREPLNAYGRSKAVGELALERSGCRYLLIRTSWLYAPWGKNFVLTMLNLTASRDELKVVHDQRGRPTSCTELAKNTLALLRAGATGPYHLSDAGECTWCEFTREIATQAGNTCTVHPCTTDEFPRPAKRPAYSVLDLAAAQRLIGEIKPWQDALADCLAMRSHTQPTS